MRLRLTTLATLAVAACLLPSGAAARDQAVLNAYASNDCTGPATSVVNAGGCVASPFGDFAMKIDADEDTWSLGLYADESTCASVPVVTFNGNTSVDCLAAPGVGSFFVFATFRAEAEKKHHHHEEIAAPGVDTNAVATLYGFTTGAACSQSTLAFSVNINSGACITSPLANYTTVRAIWIPQTNEWKLDLYRNYACYGTPVNTFYGQGPQCLNADSTWGSVTTFAFATPLTSQCVATQYDAPGCTGQPITEYGVDFSGKCYSALSPNGFSLQFTLATSGAWLQARFNGPNCKDLNLSSKGTLNVCSNTNLVVECTSETVSSSSLLKAKDRKHRGKMLGEK